MSRGNWMYQIGENEIWRSGLHETKEEAAAECLKEYAEEGNRDEKCYVGRLEVYQPFINASTIIEGIQEDAYEECGETADDYLDEANKEQLEELDKKLNQVLNDWLTKHKLRKEIGSIIDVEEI